MQQQSTLTHLPSEPKLFMLSSMDSWLACRTVRLGISTARPVSVLLWMPPFSFRPSVSTVEGTQSEDPELDPVVVGLKPEET